MEGSALLSTVRIVSEHDMREMPVSLLSIHSIFLSV